MDRAARLTRLTQVDQPVFIQKNSQGLNASLGRVLKPIADADNVARGIKCAETLTHYGLEFAQSQNETAKATIALMKDVRGLFASSRMAKAVTYLGNFDKCSELDAVVPALDKVALSLGLFSVSFLQLIIFLHKKGILPLDASLAQRLEYIFPRAGLFGNGIAVAQNGYRCYRISALIEDYKTANVEATRKGLVTVANTREKDINNADFAYRTAFWGSMKYGSDGLLQVLTLLGIVPEKVAFMTTPFYAKMVLEVTASSIGAYQAWMSTEPKDKH